MSKDNEYSMNTVNEPWLSWAVELQALAQAGLAYGRDKFDIERFTRIREIAAEMISTKTAISLDTVQNLFCNETGYQTPKIDSRAVVIKDNKILLVKESSDGTWALPGGWVDVNQSIRSNIEKEAKEEAGVDVIAKRILALHDRNRHNLPPYIYGVCKVFVLCELIGGSFEANIETLDAGYFGLNELPELSVQRNTYEQIKMCFDAAADETWEVEFD